MWRNFSTVSLYLRKPLPHRYSIYGVISQIYQRNPPKHFHQCIDLSHLSFLSREGIGMFFIAQSWSVFFLTLGKRNWWILWQNMLIFERGQSSVRDVWNIWNFLNNFFTFKYPHFLKAIFTFFSKIQTFYTKKLKHS